MIRPATPLDFPAIRDLLDANKMLQPGVRYTEFSPLCLVYVLHGRVIGVIQVLMGKPYASVEFLAIAPEHQHRGFGARLFDAAELVLRAYDIPAMVMGTESQEVTHMLIRRGATAVGLGTALMKVLV